MQDGQGVEVLEAGGLDDAHQDLMVLHAFFGAVPEGDFTHDHVVAKQPLRQVVVPANARRFQTGDPFAPLGREFGDEFIGTRMSKRGLEHAA